eukprot:scaffold9286_cov76-Phaeocystis_antarctica.AAC.1
MSSGTAASRDESSLRSSSTSEPLKMGMPRHLRGCVAVLYGEAVTSHFTVPPHSTTPVCGHAPPCFSRSIFLSGSGRARPPPLWRSWPQDSPVGHMFCDRDLVEVLLLLLLRDSLVMLLAMVRVGARVRVRDRVRGHRDVARDASQPGRLEARQTSG